MSTTDHTPSDPATTRPSSGLRQSLDRSTPSRLADRAAGALRTLGTGAVGLVADATRALAFWVAALLPLTYLPALVTGAAGQRPLTLLGVLVAHGVALVVGRGHAMDE